MQMRALQIHARQVRFGQIYTAQIGLDARLPARFHPHFVLIQNLGKIEQRDSDGISPAQNVSSSGMLSCDLALQFFNFFDCVNFQAHSNVLPQVSLPALAHAGALQLLKPAHNRAFQYTRVLCFRILPATVRIPPL